MSDCLKGDELWKSFQLYKKRIESLLTSEDISNFDELKNVYTLLVEHYDEYAHKLPSFNRKTIMELLETTKNKINQKAVSFPDMFGNKMRSEKSVHLDLINEGANIVEKVPISTNTEVETHLPSQKNVFMRISSIQDCNLSELRDCTVLLEAEMDVLILSELRNVNFIIIKEIKGSIKISNTSQCRFFILAQQIRLFNCKDCAFYVNLFNKGAISLEESSKCYFGPLVPYFNSFDDVTVSTLLKSMSMRRIDYHKSLSIKDFSSVSVEESSNILSVLSLPSYCIGIKIINDTVQFINIEHIA